MAYGIKTGNPRGFSKGRNSKFREGSRVRQTLEEGWRTYRPKRYGNNKKDENNGPKTLNDKNRLTVYKKWLMSNKIVSVAQQYLKLFKRVKTSIDTR